MIEDLIGGMERRPADAWGRRRIRGPVVGSGAHLGDLRGRGAAPTRGRTACWRRSPALGGIPAALADSLPDLGGRRFAPCRASTWRRVARTENRCLPVWRCEPLGRRAQATSCGSGGCRGPETFLAARSVSSLQPGWWVAAGPRPGRTQRLQEPSPPAGVPRGTPGVRWPQAGAPADGLAAPRADLRGLRRGLRGLRDGLRPLRRRRDDAAVRRCVPALCRIVPPDGNRASVAPHPRRLL